MGYLWQGGPLPFLFITVLLGGGAAMASGRAMARAWRPFWRLIAYMLLLAAAVRFFHFSLFGGTLLSAHYFAVDAAVLILAASAGFRVTRVRQMVTQYRWLYERSGPFSWRPRGH
ncbi:MAG TPA: hypothetical protein PK405_00375 [Hyphomicrobiales bacterium]|nr:hypothetical protein [Rhodobiaceae bacterium]HXK53116.1 hypothetical protein [Hyphomicrobiales bacterium]